MSNKKLESIPSWCIKNYDDFATQCCIHCDANEWYCSSECELLEKGRNIPFEKIQAKYIQYEGDLKKVCRYIRRSNFEMKQLYKFRGRKVKVELNSNVILIGILRSGAFIFEKPRKMNAYWIDNGKPEIYFLPKEVKNIELLD